MKQTVSKASEYMRTHAVTAVKRVPAHAKRKKREAQSEVRPGKTPSKSVGGVFFLRMTVKRVPAHAKRKKREAQSEVRPGKTPSKSVGGVFFLRMTGDAYSTAIPPWEWCNRNRTMTAAQKIAERAYNDSKFGGFVALFVSTIVILLLYIIYKYCQERGVPSEQTAAEQGTTGAQESSGQRTPTHTRTPHDNCQDTARTQERSGQQTSTCVNTEAEGLPMAKLPATEEN
ncbi:hypothetical protein SRHO_G00233630 [Serrasalmus rhombeus]